MPGDKQLWKPARQDKLIPGDVALILGVEPQGAAAHRHHRRARRTA